MTNNRSTRAPQTAHAWAITQMVNRPFWPSVLTIAFIGGLYFFTKYAWSQQSWTGVTLLAILVLMPATLLIAWYADYRQQYRG